MIRIHKSQKGVSTLVFSIIVLLLVTFVSLYTSKSIITETKISNNEVRAGHAFEAAEAGINLAFAQLKLKKRPNRGFGVFGDLLETPVILNTYSSNVYEIPNDDTSREIGHFEVSVSEVKDSNGNLLGLSVTSEGLSDDYTASKKITVFANNAEAIANTPDHPVTAKGNVLLTGTVSVYNQEGASTIWSGGSINTTGSGKTYIANPADPEYPKCLDDSFFCEAMISSEGAVGVDVIENDTSLSNMDDDEVFENFFGLSKSDYQASGAVNTFLTIGSGGKTVYKNIDPETEFVPQNHGNETIWVDVPIGSEFSFNDVLGCNDSSAFGSDTYTNQKTHCENTSGSDDSLEPVILIVDGEAKFNGNTHIYGLVFVTGDLKSAGTPDITGALISTGTVGQNGSVVVRYNSSVISGFNDNPDYFVTPGSWRDWD